MAVAVAAALGLVGCASHHTKPAAVTPAPQQTTSQPQVFQQRSYACGSGIAPPVAPSTSSNPVRLAITETEFVDNRITAAYKISSPDPSEVLSYPVSPTPPTVLLMDGGHIVGLQKPSRSSTVDGRPAEMRPIGRHPYLASLTVDELCPGTDWARVRAHPDQYRVEIVMSRQPTSGPQTAPPPTYLADPLTTASAGLGR
ncbi:hypothetical protein RKE30_38465 [Streptomyces sp. Li-HN-5-11]|uniref:hypothetical protein n=1 Tax=Streptomyces sp. Li-HN-5-11 TaxID=3075432 RepID=UPI0028A6E098|nr:hypothetical protein [Streptomyces sp. Li-HN-5-11]WNM35824.1 hypothetical protein RKE30_38465 [Streptomyces sp. Li-HN-5-11]